MEIKQVTLADKEWVTEFALIEAHRYPYLRPNREKMDGIFTNAVSSGNGFAMKAVRGDKPLGVLLAISLPHAWAEKQVSHCVLFATKKAPSGAMLVRRYAEWIKGRPVVRVGGFAPARELDIRTTRLLEHFGFNKVGGDYAIHKGY